MAQLVSTAHGTVRVPDPEDMTPRQLALAKRVWAWLLGDGPPPAGIPETSHVVEARRLNAEWENRQKGAA